MASLLLATRVRQLAPFFQRRRTFLNDFISSKSDSPPKGGGNFVMEPLIAADFSKLMTSEQRELLRKQKDVMLALQDQLADMEASEGDRQILRDTIANLDEMFLVCVVGEFNAGKSSLINALLGDRYLEDGVLPTTSKPHLVKYAPHVSLSVLDRGRGAEADEMMVLTLPVPWLRYVHLVDTPGTNAIMTQHERVTDSVVPRCDMLLFVTSADRPFSESERAFLGRIHKWKKKVVVIINKMDLLQSEKERSQVLRFVRENAELLLRSEPGQVNGRAAGAPAASISSGWFGGFSSGSRSGSPGSYVGYGDVASGDCMGVPLFPVSSRLALASKHMARAMSQRRAGVSADATSLELGGPANPNAPDLVEGSAGEAETRFRLSGFGDLEQFVVQHLQGEEKVWWKLQTPLGVGERLAATYGAAAAARCRELEQDRKTLAVVAEQTEAFRMEMRREFKEQRQRVSRAVRRYGDRADAFVADVVRWRNAPALLQSGYFAASFDSALGLGLGPRLAGRGFEARDSVVGRLGFSSVDGGARTGGRTFPADGDGALPLPLGLGNLDREVAEVTREVTDTVLFKTNAQASAVLSYVRRHATVKADALIASAATTTATPAVTDVSSTAQSGANPSPGSSAAFPTGLRLELEDDDGGIGFGAIRRRGSPGFPGTLESNSRVHAAVADAVASTAHAVAARADAAGRTIKKALISAAAMETGAGLGGFALFKIKAASAAASAAAAAGGTVAAATGSVGAVASALSAPAALAGGSVGALSLAALGLGILPALRKSERAAVRQHVERLCAVLDDELERFQERELRLSEERLQYALGPMSRYIDVESSKRAGTLEALKRTSTELRDIRRQVDVGCENATALARSSSSNLSSSNFIGDKNALDKSNNRSDILIKRGGSGVYEFVGASREIFNGIENSGSGVQAVEKNQVGPGNDSSGSSNSEPSLLSPWPANLRQKGSRQD